MKIRKDFVTNSSSSSFILCFARVADKEKAEKILDKYKSDIEVYTAKEALAEIERGSKWFGWLDYDWAGVFATPDKELIESNMDSDFIVITGGFDIDEDPWGDTNYNVDYEDFDTAAIDEITEENGFSDIDVQYGAGRNG